MRGKFQGKTEEDDLTWQAVYMDLITMVMIFFLIMWVISNGKEDRGDIRIAKKDVPSDKLFKSGDSKLMDSARSAIDEALFDRVAPLPKLGELKNSKGKKTGARRILMVYGHTDDVGVTGGRNPIRDQKQNMLLGFKRAYSVYKYVLTKRPDFEGNVGVCSFASYFPATKVPAKDDEILEGLPPKEKKTIKRKMRIGGQRNRSISFEVVNRNNGFMDKENESSDK